MNLHSIHHQNSPEELPGRLGRGISDVCSDDPRPSGARSDPRADATLGGLFVSRAEGCFMTGWWFGTCLYIFYFPSYMG